MGPVYKCRAEEIVSFPVARLTCQTTYGDTWRIPAIRLILAPEGDSNTKMMTRKLIVNHYLPLDFHWMVVGLWDCSILVCSGRHILLLWIHDRFETGTGNMHEMRKFKLRYFWTWTARCSTELAQSNLFSNRWSAVILVQNSTSELITMHEKL